MLNLCAGVSVHIDKSSCLYRRREYSFLIMSENNKLRKFCYNIVTWRHFDNVILVIIFLNCICMAMESRKSIIHTYDSDLQKFLQIADNVFTIVFAIEMLLKVVAFCFLWGKKAYIKDPWNILDGVLVIICVGSLVLELIGSIDTPKILQLLRILRLLRALRPLRAINRLPSLKLTVQSLTSSVNDIANMLAIATTFFVIFAILATQIFRGTMYYCEGPMTDDVRTKNECVNASTENEWVNAKLHFDNVLQSLLTLFVISTMDAWVTVMHQGVDAVGIDKQPIQNYNQWAILFFVVFLLIVGYFVLSMFIGILVESFRKTNEKLTRERAIEKSLAKQKNLQQGKKSRRRSPDVQSFGKARGSLYKVLQSKIFSVFIYGCIIVSVLTMATEYYGMSSTHGDILDVLAAVFCGIFLIESTLKIMVFGKYYFYDGWNVLDFVIVLMSTAAVLLEHVDFLFQGNVPPILRAVRVFRVLRLLKMTSDMRGLVVTLGMAIPQIANLGLLLGLLFFIYAALGVELLRTIDCTPLNLCEGLSDQHAHFKNFGMAFLTLFRISTGDNWSGILKDVLRTPPACTPPPCVQNCCINHGFSILYFVTFVLLAQFILLNLVVAMLMKSFEEANKNMFEECFKNVLSIVTMLPAPYSTDIGENDEYMFELQEQEQQQQQDIT